MDIAVVKKRQRNIIIMLMIISTLSYLAMQATDFDMFEALGAFPNALLWMGTQFYPNQQSLSNMPSILINLQETVLLAIATTTTSAVLALTFALTDTRNNIKLEWLMKFTASIFRNIPDIVWAIVLLLTFGQNIIAGFFALFFASFGFLIRAFSESIAEAGHSSIEALEASGAGYCQVVFQAIIPSCITQIVTWILYMVETNIRSSTLVGILTGTGIGNLFNLYYKSFDYHSASLVVIMLIVVILALEFVSNYVRRAIL